MGWRKYAEKLIEQFILKLRKKTSFLAPRLGEEKQNKHFIHPLFPSLFLIP